jgi:hypothetical protein
MQDHFHTLKIPAHETIQYRRTNRSKRIYIKHDRVVEGSTGTRGRELVNEMEGSLLGWHTGKMQTQEPTGRWAGPGPAVYQDMLIPVGLTHVVRFPVIIDSMSLSRVWQEADKQELRPCYPVELLKDGAVQYGSHQPCVIPRVFEMWLLGWSLRK